MKTKFLSLVAMLVLLVVMLASCDGNSTDGPKPDPTPDEDISYNYTWGETKLIAQLNMDSNNSELTSGTKRYYAGEDRTQSSDIDKSIRARNEAAELAANVDVTYAYLEDGNGYAWGTNVENIQIKVKSGDADAPDIYCNFAYDMTCAALRGCFANLLTEDYQNGNFFLFTEDDYDPSSDNYFDAEAGKGYFYQYMESLSLDPENKLYCLASNYCTDMVRAFLAVPVNVKMINGIDQAEASKIVGGDQNGDNVIDVLDFYEYVWDGNWTYDTLAKYSALVYQQGAGTAAGADVGDTLGFCLGKGSGLPASGILYTSSVKIITKNANTGKYEYGTTNPGLDSLVSALKNLMEQPGIAVATASDFKTVLGYSPATELIGIRERFADNKILFGGIITVGSLEDTVYQEMRAGLGFGVVPVPTYQASDEYLTLVHSIARIVSISVTSTKFSQCSAFLDYLSRTSADILDQYYNNELTAKTGGVAGENNALMLTYIRNHVRDCFDKTVEDMIADNMIKDDPSAYNYRWHDIIMDRNYKLDDFRSLYQSLYETKQKQLDKIVKDWGDL